MMKKKVNKSELGSIMIEALAMLALIALVTPILYKKSAERTTELQDINAAGELRAIVKGVDDYISANYDAIVRGETVSNNCPGSNSSQSYATFTNATDANMTVPIGHFCEFLPYGILDGNGDAKNSRLFSKDYQIVLKLKGSNPEAESIDVAGDKVVTAFVITDPRIDLTMVRSSSIASMIGGNGGYVSEAGSGDEGSGKILGNMGIWGIDDTRNELGVTVKQGAVVAASIEGISSQNAKLDLDGVLYRAPKQDLDLNTMSTTLYMGVANEDTFGNDIVNIGRLIVGKLASDNDDDRLYIDSGDIRIGQEDGEGGSIYLDGQGDITLADGGIDVTGGDVAIHSKASAEGGEGSETGGNLIVDREISAADNLFQVAMGGIVNAVTYFAGDVDNPSVSIHEEYESGKFKTSVREPLEVVAEGNCNYTINEGGDATLTSDCALFVKGDSLFNGNVTVTDTFSAKNLHAQEKLTVGGTGADESKALRVVYTPGTDGADGQSSFDFGSGLLKINQTGPRQGNLDFADTLFTIDTDATEGGTNIGKLVKVNAADMIDLNTPQNRLFMNHDYIWLDSSGNGELAQMSLSSTNTADTDAGAVAIRASNYISLNDEAFKVAYDDNSKDVITSIAKSFTIMPDEVTNKTTQYFRVSNNEQGDANMGEVVISELPTYMLDTNQYLRNSVFHVQKQDADGYTDVVRIGENTGVGTNQGQVDISGDSILMHGNNTERASETENKILKIDLTNLRKENDDNDDYAIYIRRGAIELNSETMDDSKEFHNYVKADYFVSNTGLSDSESSIKALVDGSSETHYLVNPAYTSVMHDIKLTTRGGARLSDILPDFINKGIYVVDNTYPAKGETCNGSGGKTLEDYMNEGQTNNSKTCDSIYQEVSPWTGFVPSPTCPPGYSKVITITPASIAMSQAGIPFSEDTWKSHPDLSVPLVVKSPYDYLDETSGNVPPTPLYFQKNTWLKSSVSLYPNEDSFRGWNVLMGFIYPYNLYSSYIRQVGSQFSGNYELDESGCNGSHTGDSCVYWNLFPVYAGTLEGYATVYCYFKRNSEIFNDKFVDKDYDQLNNYRAPNVKNNGVYTNRLNDDRGTLNEW